EYPSGDWLEVVELLIAWTTLLVDPYDFRPEEPMHYARIQSVEQAGRFTYDLSVDRPANRFRTKKTFRILKSSGLRQNLWVE
ncbi:MAG: hypothetical protein GY906_28270, partial [bacterium]|nr:hypothetical protein [bacterium]